MLAQERVARAVSGAPSCKSSRGGLLWQAVAGVMNSLGWQITYNEGQDPREADTITFE